MDKDEVEINHMKYLLKLMKNNPQNFTKNFQLRFLFRIGGNFSHTGDSWLWCGILFLLWIFSNVEQQKVLAFWGLSIAFTAFFIFFLKKVIHRSRPEGDWGMVYRKRDPHSFPSGHAVRAGLILMLAWKTFGMPYFLVFLIWAVFMIFEGYYRSTLFTRYLLGVIFDC
jgi:undecaprenyl-diphosphatase